MNKFNKLYNLILESIINQNKESRAKILATRQDHQAIQNFLNQLAQKSSLYNKIADFLAKFFKSGQLTDIKDKRIQQVIDILERNTTFNIQTQITLDQFLKQNQKYLTRELANKTDDLIAYIDKNISEFTEKKVYDNGVVIYRVDESRAGQAAVRKIIDMQWGQKANPWCLASRKGGIKSNYKGYWNQYNAYPKHIAFQNGKLLAFCADEYGNCTWWDRNDNSDNDLHLLDGSYMQTDKYEWTPEEYKQLFLIKNNLVLNKKTGRYDSNGNVKVDYDDIKQGHFPVKFGVINGDFDCSYCKNLTSNQGAPIKVTGKTYYDGCTNLPNYNQIISEYFIKNNGLILNKQTGRYDSEENVKITNDDLIDGHFSIKFGVIKGNFSCSRTHIQTLQNGPTYVGGNFYCSQCKSLLTLEGAPRKVTGTFECSDCQNLTSLQGGPEYVGGEYYIPSCSKLKNLIGMPKKINSLNTSWVLFQSLEGCPEEIEDHAGFRCHNLTSFKYFPKKIGGDLYLFDVPKRLKSELETVLKNVEIGGKSHINYERV